jgi:hypothetical protein
MAALASYADLVNAIARWTDRDDLTGDIDTFIALFEATFNHRYKLDSMGKSSDRTYDPVSGSYSLPDDFISMRDVHVTGQPNRILTPAAASFADVLYPQSGVQSQYYYMNGDRIFAAPSDGSAITVRYYAKLPTLSASTTNWLFVRLPNAYFFGALIEAYMANQEEDRAALWRARYNEIDELLIRNDAGRRFVGAQVRARSQTP